MKSILMAIVAIYTLPSFAVQEANLSDVEYQCNYEYEDPSMAVVISTTVIAENPRQAVVKAAELHASHYIQNDKLVSKPNRLGERTIITNIKCFSNNEYNKIQDCYQNYLNQLVGGGDLKVPPKIQTDQQYQAFLKTLTGGDIKFDGSCESK